MPRIEGEAGGAAAIWLRRTSPRLELLELGDLKPPSRHQLAELGYLFDQGARADAGRTLRLLEPDERLERRKGDLAGFARSHDRAPRSWWGLWALDPRRWLFLGWAWVSRAGADELADELATINARRLRPGRRHFVVAQSGGFHPRTPKP